MAKTKPECSRLISSLKALANDEDARQGQRFFKTGPGEYGEGDLFLGIRMPAQRKQAQLFKDMTLSEIRQCLKSPFHEVRMTSLLILVLQFKRADSDHRTRIFKLYCASTRYINNWDLVDVTAPHIVGQYLLDQERALLYKFAESNDLWKKRIAIISTFSFIRQNQFKDTLAISQLLMKDSHDLIHKAVGWMLREVGNRDRRAEETFLKEHYANMPRTMLRYAIEKFPENRRQQYLQGKVRPL